MIKTVTPFAFMLLTMIACKKNTPSIPTIPTAPAVSTPVANFYFTATIDGKSVDINDLSGVYGSGAGASSTTSKQHEQSLFIGNALTGYPSAGAIIVQNFSTSVEKCSQVESMFRVGTYTYANTYSGIDGAGIYYTDDQGDYWSTSFDSTTTQPSSNFEIISHTVNTDGYSEYISEITFNCTLYDLNGNSKTLTNGNIKSRSVQCIDLE